MPSSRPRRELRSPLTAPTVSSGTVDLERHDRLEQHGVGLLVGLLERHRAGDLERHLRRVDVVVRAVDEPDADALHRRAGELAVLHRLLDALVDGRAGSPAG